MLFSEWYNKQCIHKNWQSYTQINRGTICAKELPFRVQPFRGVDCGLIPSAAITFKRYFIFNISYLNSFTGTTTSKDINCGDTGCEIDRSHCTNLLTDLWTTEAVTRIGKQYIQRETLLSLFVIFNE